MLCLLVQQSLPYLNSVTPAGNSSGGGPTGGGIGGRQAIAAPVYCCTLQCCRSQKAFVKSMFFFNQVG